MSGDLAELFPQTKHLYMFRTPAEYVRSMRSVFKSLLHPVVRHLLIFLSVEMGMAEFILQQLGPPTQQEIQVLLKTTVQTA